MHYPLLRMLDQHGRTLSFLLSWTGDAHEETDFLPIGDREEKSMGLLSRRTDNLRDKASTRD